MFVKICGITRLEDAEAAVAAGAGALGFVFWPESPRFIDPYRARTIIRALPPFVTTVGVFVNQPAGYIASVANLAQLGAVQLHGDESVGYAESIARPILKALPLATAADPARLDEWPQRMLILLDVHDPVRRGGTGQRIDWSAAAAVSARRRVLLAGGLTPGNVADAIIRVRPFGIDVSSGVERAPGVKDHARLGALFESVNASTHLAPRS